MRSKQEIEGMREERGHGVVSLDGRRYGWLRIDKRWLGMLRGHPRPLKQHGLSLSLSQCFYVSLTRALSFSLSAQVSSKLEIFKN